MSEVSRGVRAHGQATVGVSAVVLRAANFYRRSIIIQNLGTGDLFVGSSTVTTGNSPKIKVDGNIVLDKSVDAIYAIASAGGTDVRFIEELDLS